MADKGDDNTRQPLAAVQVLTEVEDALTTTRKLLDTKAHDPIKELAVALEHLDGYLSQADSFFGCIDNVIRFVKRALDVISTLGGVPVVGPTISGIARTIERLDVLNLLKAGVEEMKRVVHQAKTEFIDRAKNGIADLLKKIEGLTGQIPGWVDSIDFMKKAISIVYDIFKFFRGILDKEMTSVFAGLENIAAGPKQQFEAIKEALKPIEDFVEHELKDFTTAVTNALGHGFDAVLAIFKPIGDALGSCVSVFEHIESIFAPLFWVLKCISSITNSVLGPAIDFVKSSLKLDNVIHDFESRIEAFLGIKTVKEDLEKIAEGALKALLEPLEGKLKDVDFAAKASSLEATLQAFQRSPTDGIVKMIDTVWNAKDNRFEPLDVFKPQLVTVGVVLPARVLESAVTDHPMSAASFVIKRQTRLNDYILESSDKLRQGNAVRLSVRSAAAAVPTDTSALSIEAPQARQGALPEKIGYAFDDGLPVSVLIRTRHKRVLELQESARNTPLGSMAMSHDLDAGVVLNSHRIEDGSEQSPSGGKSTKFDTFCRQRASFMSKTDRVMGDLDAMLAIAKQADQDFGAFSPAAVSFGSNLVAMFNGVDPLLLATEKLIHLPFEYINQVKTFFREKLNVPEVALKALDILSAIADDIIKAIEDFKDKKEKVLNRAKSTSEEYAKAYNAVAALCSMEWYHPAETPGATVHNITSLVELLQRRVQSNSMNFEAMYNMGKAIYEDDRQQPGRYKAEFFEKLDGVFDILSATLENTTHELKELSYSADERDGGGGGLLRTLYRVLAAVHADVRVFFQASQAISEQCLAVEAKAISVDSVRDAVIQFGNAVEPLKNVLEQVGLSPDRESSATSWNPVPGKIESAVETFLSPIALNWTKDLLEHAFQVDDIDKSLTDIQAKLQVALEKEHLPALANAISELVDKVTPKHVHAYATPPGSQSRDKTFAVLSPLLDEETATMLGAQLADVQEAAKDNTPPLDWASLTWCRRWDIAEPEYPSVIFMEWYRLLEELDRLIDSQRKLLKASEAKVPEHIATAKSPSVIDLWKQLGDAANTDTADAYDMYLNKPLRLPIRDRIEQLLRGVLRIQPPSTSQGTPQTPSEDLLKTIKRQPDSSRGNGERYKLPDAIKDLVDASFGTGQIPEELNSLWNDQADFEGAVVRLGPFGITRETNLGLEGIHQGYNLMAVRALLALTGDETKAREYGQMTGCFEGGQFVTVPLKK